MKTFTWDKVEGADEYRIYRKKRVGGEWRLVAKTRRTRWIWEKPTPGDWMFKVTASNRAGEGGPSREIRVKIKARG